MEKFELILTEAEMLDLTEEQKKDENILGQILLAKALYNESLDVEFSEEENKQIWFDSENSILDLYMRQKVAPRVAINENTIIDEYNANKAYFEENNIAFNDARNIIAQKLTELVNEGLFEDLVKKLMSEMDENISLSKEDILFTKGDPGLIKAILLFAVLGENAKKENFFEENAQLVADLRKNARLNFYVNKLIRERTEVKNEAVLEKMQELTKENFELVKDYSQEQLFNFVGEKMLENRAIEVRNEIYANCIKENNIEEIVKGLIK